MQPSIFTKIINREIPASIVYEDDHVIAFLDMFPLSKGHTLVVPKNQQNNLLESSEEDLAQVLRVVRKIGPVVRDAVGAEAFHVIANVGETITHVSNHTHFHIVPRSKDDGVLPWNSGETTEEERTALADQIKNAL